LHSLTAEDMTMGDIKRQRRSAQTAALTAEDMMTSRNDVAPPSAVNRARRDANVALTAEDMIASSSALTSERKLQRAKRNIYDDDDENDEDGGYGYEDEDESRDSDIYDGLDDEAKELLLRYIESNPDVLDALSQYGVDERERQEREFEEAKEEEEREEVKEALRYLDQLDATNEQEDDSDLKIEYEPIVYHGEPGIFIPIPDADDAAADVEKRSDGYGRWQEIEEQADQEREEEEYEEAYGKLLELAKALRQRDNDK